MGASINDVRKIFWFFYPLPLLSAFSCNLPFWTSLLCLLFQGPLPPMSADVIYESSLTQIIGIHTQIITRPATSPSSLSNKEESEMACGRTETEVTEPPPILSHAFCGFSNFLCWPPKTIRVIIGRQRKIYVHTWVSKVFLKVMCKCPMAPRMRFSDVPQLPMTWKMRPLNLLALSLSF